MNEPGVGVRKIGQISVAVQDLERATSFYRDVLELQHLFDAPPSMSFFACGGTRLMLAVPDGADGQGTSILYLEVPDIAGAARALQARGVTFDREPHEAADLGDRVLWLAFFRDSESNLVALMSEPLKEPV